MKNLANENFPVPRFMARRRWGKAASYGLLVYLMVVGGREGKRALLTCVWPRLKDIQFIGHCLSTGFTSPSGLVLPTYSTQLNKQQCPDFTTTGELNGNYLTYFIASILSVDYVRSSTTNTQGFVKHNLTEQYVCWKQVRGWWGRNGGKSGSFNKTSPSDDVLMILRIVEKLNIPPDNRSGLATNCCKIRQSLKTEIIKICFDW